MENPGYRQLCLPDGALDSAGHAVSCACAERMSGRDPAHLAGDGMAREHYACERSNFDAESEIDDWLVQR